MNNIILLTVTIQQIKIIGIGNLQIIDVKFAIEQFILLFKYQTWKPFPVFLKERVHGNNHSVSQFVYIP